MVFPSSATAVLLVFAMGIGATMADVAPAPASDIRVVSWNVSGDAFVSKRREFQALLRRANPDLLLLDEVVPSADVTRLRKALAALGPSQKNGEWHIHFGASGGRQRGVIASRARLELLPEFAEIVPYPEQDRRAILEKMPAADRHNRDWTMDGGIPVNGAIVLTGERRLMVVVADLQCCGNDPGSWQEFRRRIEVREIRRLIRQVLERVSVDAVVVAGDFNLVSTAVPLIVLTGPYRAPHAGLKPAELYHSDGATSWTWDGRGTRFPSRALDFQLYTPGALLLHNGFILDTEKLPDDVLKKSELRQSSSRDLSSHLPLVVDYAWR